MTVTMPFCEAMALGVMFEVERVMARLPQLACNDIIHFGKGVLNCTSSVPISIVSCLSEGP